ncbi:phage capsid scaffolding protein [Pseudomonas asuensis]|uniref:Phage capsid scaffolding protein n=1 Tax=Pseudomonas asuensis TaxID=1825787 RepID=A0ABQ2H448_9PSED|nr:GPO family capsid scaffolding protein [Pseudomonas asuensis]GGM30399.1 phage capsid scaffolding protein [Pseudomonas asuensis]
MSTKKKFRSKQFRVAVEGATTDGRTIERSWIEQMAANYDPKVYGARIWMEHFRSTLADSPFRAYGDVLALSTGEVEINGEKKLALFAQIEPTDDLVNIVNNLKQKVYTSIEVNEKFGSSGQAYLVGLAVTDSPASIGTEMLSFAAQNPEASPLKARKQSPDNLFTACEETCIELEEVQEKASIGSALFTRIQDMFKSKQVQDNQEFTQFGEAVVELAGHVRDQGEDLAKVQSQQGEFSQGLEALEARLTELTDTLGKTADHSQQQRPPATGSTGQILTAY